jgi:hypothetical protein
MPCEIEARAETAPVLRIWSIAVDLSTMRESSARGLRKLARGGAIKPYFPMLILLKAAATS